MSLTLEMANRERDRDYTFLGRTDSLCPECLELVPAKIIARGKRVYFRKRCKEHGLREDFVCSDVAWYDRYDYALPPRLPKFTAVRSSRGCPFDCGLCEEHEQHTCIGVLEITEHCNLTCPVCYADSSPSGKHRSLEEVKRGIDTLVKAEGEPDVLQLSGGEPTLHPQFREIVEYALAQPIRYVMINTNGIPLARDPALLEILAPHRDRVEIYLQYDGHFDEVHRALRGASLQSVKQEALSRIGQSGLHVTLVAALQAGVNDGCLGALLRLAEEHPYVTGLSLQPATYSGRVLLPESLEQRVTFPDVIEGLCEQSDGRFEKSDFFPLPCAHPNCHILALAFRRGGKLIPLTRFLSAKDNLDLLANGLSFTREEGIRLAKLYLARNEGCGPQCGPGGCGATTTGLANDGLPAVHDLRQSFLEGVLAKAIGAEQLLRITITSFLDAYNFDVRRVMKCCTHHVLPTGHIIPFCAYNVLYRSGKVPLPKLAQ